MNDLSQPRATRAPRAHLSGAVSVLVQLENLRRIPAKLHSLSTTGGLLELPKCLDERAKVGLTISLGSCTVRLVAQMLFPMHGVHNYLQPFRFTGLAADDLQILNKEITELLKQPMATTKGPEFGSRRPCFYLESF